MKRRRHIPGGQARMERRNSGQDVIGWKVRPRAWCGQLPGKGGPTIRTAKDIHDWTEAEKQRKEQEQNGQ